MRIFFAIVLIILLTIGGGIFYVMHEMGSKPEIIKQIPQADFNSLKSDAANVKIRVRQQLDAGGSARLNSEDFSALLFGQLQRKSRLDLTSMVKKYDCKIHDGRLHVKAVIDLKKLGNSKLPAEARRLFDLVADFIPDGTLENVYIGLDGTPVEKDGKIDFSDNSTVTLGGFTRSIREAKGKRHINISIKSLRKMGVTGFKMGDDFIEVHR